MKSPRDGSMAPNPCPWPECGGDADVVVIKGNACYWVQCFRCGARGPDNGVRKEAVALWNRIRVESGQLARSLPRDLPPEASVLADHERRIAALEAASCTRGERQ